MSTLLPAERSGDRFLSDVERAPAGPDRLTAWWLGQSGFLVVWDGHRLLFDPYLSDSLTEKYADTDKPHVRLSEQVVDPAQLTGLAAITSSHNHTDHLDAATLKPLAAANPGTPLVLPSANTGFARERLTGAGTEMSLAGIDAGETTQAGPFAITGIPAAHNTVERDEAGRHRFLGFVVRCGPFTLFHSGDTLWHDGLVPALIPHGPFDLVFHPINGNVPERRVAGNLNGTEAAGLARAVNARLVVPHHFEMFAFNTAPPDEFEQACERLGQNFATLRGGGRVDLSAAKGG